MAEELEKVLSPFYCKLALVLCQQARVLLFDDELCNQASEICRFISTLCSKNACKQCLEESHLCSMAADLCISPEKVGEAKSICDSARRVCPKGFTVRAS